MSAIIVKLFGCEEKPFWSMVRRHCGAAPGPYLLAAAICFSLDYCDLLIMSSFSLICDLAGSYNMYCAALRLHVRRDMECIDSLAEAINSYEGGLVLVSHDFRLIEQVHIRNVTQCSHEDFSLFLLLRCLILCDCLCSCDVLFKGCRRAR